MLPVVLQCAVTDSKIEAESETEERRREKRERGERKREESSVQERDEETSSCCSALCARLDSALAVCGVSALVLPSHKSAAVSEQ